VVGPIYRVKSERYKIDRLRTTAHVFYANKEKFFNLCFHRKVFGILSAQLLVTFGVVAIFVFVDGVKEYARNNWELALGSSIATIVIVIALSCCGNLRRRAPLNLILLAFFTVLEGFMLGSFAACFEVCFHHLHKVGRQSKFDLS
jgi:FtsH-binding integral membrane protein